MYGTRRIVKCFFLWDSITTVGLAQEALTHKHAAPQTSIKVSGQVLSPASLEIYCTQADSCRCEPRYLVGLLHIDIYIYIYITYICPMTDIKAAAV